MIDLSTLQAKVDALKAQILQNSISPVYLGTILDEFIGRMADLDVTDLVPEIQTAIKNADDALEAASQAVSTAGAASENAADAVEKATEALAKANAAIAAAQAAQTAAESAAVSAAIANSFADELAAVKRGAIARFSEIVTDNVTTTAQPGGSGSQSGGQISGSVQPEPGGGAGSDVVTLDSVVYLKTKKAFALKSGSNYYLPWTDALHPMSMYNDSSDKALKNKIFICADRAYVWSLSANDLVEIAAGKADRSMFVTISDTAYDALPAKDNDVFYYIYEE